MSVVDVLVRVQTLCKKYEAYTREDVLQQASSSDNFAVLYAAISTQVEDVITVRDLPYENSLFVWLFPLF